MSAAHTAGQWEVVPLNQHGPYAIRMAYNAEQKFYGVRQIHHEADARLIAAAPDLLAALEAAVECGMVPKSSAREGGATAHARMVHVADEIRAAIAKALGEAA